MEYIILFVVSVCHIVFAIIGTRNVWRTVVLDNHKKRINIVLLWLVPFIWYWIIKSILKPTPGSSEFIDEEKRQSGQYFESGLGAPGAGLRER